MTEQIAKAQYEGQWNPPEDDYLAWDDCSIPPEKTDSPEHVASYLRFGGRISDRVLRQFIWQGQHYDPMGQKLSYCKEDRLKGLIFGSLREFK